MEPIYKDGILRRFTRNYNLKRITEQIELYQYSSFFGVIKEIVCKKELEEYPDTFKVVNKDDTEVTQKELEKMYIEKHRTA